MKTSQAVSLFLALAVLRPGGAWGGELLPARGLSIAMPEQAALAAPAGVELLSDGGFENAVLENAKAPAWQVTTHVYSPG